MNRREFLKFLGLGAIGAGLPKELGGSSSPPPSVSPLPSITREQRICKSCGFKGYWFWEEDLCADHFISSSPSPSISPSPSPSPEEGTEWHDEILRELDREFKKDA